MAVSSRIVDYSEVTVIWITITSESAVIRPQSIGGVSWAHSLTDCEIPPAYISPPETQASIATPLLREPSSRHGNRGENLPCIAATAQRRKTAKAEAE